jgi:hypothetical protein
VQQDLGEGDPEQWAPEGEVEEAETEEPHPGEAMLSPIMTSI